MEFNKVFGSVRSSQEINNKVSIDLIVSDEQSFVGEIRELYAYEGLYKPATAKFSDWKSSVDDKDVNIRNIIFDLRSEEKLLDHASMFTKYLDINIKVIVIGSVDSIKLEYSLSNLGITYFFYEGDLGNLRAYLEDNKSFDKKLSSSRVAKRILFLGTKGGIGLSTISSIIAYNLSREARMKTLFVDYDSHTINSDAFLGLKKFKLKEIAEDLDYQNVDLAISKTYIENANIENLDYLAIKNNLNSESHHTKILFELSRSLSENYSFIIDSVPCQYIDYICQFKQLNYYHRIFIVCEPSISSLRLFNKIKRKLNDSKYEVMFNSTKPKKEYLMSVKSSKEKINIDSHLEIKFEPNLEEQIIQLGIDSLKRTEFFKVVSNIVYKMTGKNINNRNRNNIFNKWFSNERD